MHISKSIYRPIYLIGFMGSGKTFWGRKWAEAVNAEFADLDALVEEDHGPIAAIFEEKGEDLFRNLETQILKNLHPKDKLIVATGGGTPCFNDNISWMNDYGVTIYLQSSPQNILNRLKHEKEKRPLIKHLNDNELLFYITEKIKEREEFYNRAEQIIPVDDLPGNFIPGFIKDMYA